MALGVDALAGCPLFSDLGEEDLRGLAALASARRFLRHAVVLTEGERGTTLYVVVAGRIKLYLSNDYGKEFILEVLGPGDYFGLTVLDGGPHPASAMTLEPATLAAIPGEVFAEYLAWNPPVALSVVRLLIGRLRRMADTVRSVALSDVQTRLMKLLRELAHDAGDGRLVIDERFTQQELGERIGASREMVNRLLKSLAAAGYVGFEGKTLVVYHRPP